MDQRLMDHRLMGSTKSIELDMGTQVGDSVLVLINHCRDMKQQEVRLRTITLLLLLSCSALVVFTSWRTLKDHQQPQSSEPSFALLKQENLCPAGESEDRRRDIIHLQGDHPESDKSWVPWHRPSLGEDQFFDQQNRSVLIPADGIYFVYTGFSLSCSSFPEAFRLFSVKLQRLPKGYDGYQDVFKVQDSLDCTRRLPVPSRSVFMGQLFKLWEGDRLSVWLEEGSELVQQSWLGFSLQ